MHWDNQALLNRKDTLPKCTMPNNISILVFLLISNSIKEHTTCCHNLDLRSRFGVLLGDFWALLSRLSDVLVLLTDTSFLSEPLHTPTRQLQTHLV